MPHPENSDCRKRVCFTLDLEPDCGGRVRSYDSLRNISKVVELFSQLDIPLTAFVTGEIFELHPEAIRALQQLDQIEFGSHSYSHQFEGVTVDEEIRRGVAAFHHYFGAVPKGYRAPRGRIEACHFETLRALGVQYDASIFPSFRPGEYNNVGAKRTPHLLHGMMEIPVTTFSPVAIPLGLGYLRLLGSFVSKQLLRATSFPETIVFVFHLHDIVETAHRDRLQGFWHFFYGRNVIQGTSLLTFVANLLQSRGYECSTMSAVAENFGVNCLDADRVEL